MSVGSRQLMTSQLSEGVTNKKLRIYSDGNEPIRLEAQVDRTMDSTQATGARLLEKT